jgi:hypothetical protein
MRHVNFNRTQQQNNTLYVDSLVISIVEEIDGSIWDMIETLVETLSEQVACRECSLDLFQFLGQDCEAILRWYIIYNNFLSRKFVYWCNVYSQLQIQRVFLTFP